MSAVLADDPIFGNPTEVERRDIQTVQHGDYIYMVDADTGETLECVGHAKAPEQFHVHDEDSAAWVLRQMREVDADIVGLIASRDAEIAAINETYGRRVRAARSRRNFWRFRYLQQLIEWGKRQIEGRKERSCQPGCAGTIGAKKTRLSLDIVDEVKAVAYAETACPDALKAVVKVKCVSKEIRDWLSSAPFPAVSVGDRREHPGTPCRRQSRSYPAKRAAQDYCQCRTAADRKGDNEMLREEG